MVLLYGPPGTGKTSIIHAVASYFQLDIDYVKTLGNLGPLLNVNKKRKSVVVIEDIDALARLDRDDDEEERTKPRIAWRNDSRAPSAGNLYSEELPSVPEPLSEPEAEGRKNRKVASDGDNRVLHDLLNTLDGFTTQHGLIVFITTNHPDKLDSALLRRGRIDLSLHVGPLGWSAARRMFVAFYGEGTTPVWDSAREFYKPTTGAELQHSFHTSAAEDAVKILKAQWKKDDS